MANRTLHSARREGEEEDGEGNLLARMPSDKTNTPTQLRLARSHERNEYDFPVGATSKERRTNPEPPIKSSNKDNDYGHAYRSSCFGQKKCTGPGATILHNAAQGIRCDCIRRAKFFSGAT